MAAAESKPSTKRVDLVAIEPIMAGGKRYEPGDLLSLPPADAEALEAMGAAAKPAKPAAAPAPAPTTPPAA